MNFLPASGGWYNCLFWCLNVICDLNEAGHCKNCCVGGYWRRVCSIWSCILSLNRYSINRYYPFIYSICFAHRGCPKLQELVVGAGCGPCVRPWHLTLTGQCPLVPGWWSAGPAGALTQGTRSCRPGNVTTACKECPMDMIHLYCSIIDKYCIYNFVVFLMALIIWFVKILDVTKILKILMIFILWFK